MKEIPLTQGKVALVDDADFERVMQHKWYAVKYGRGRKFYAARKLNLGNGQREVELLHQFVLGRKWVDHKNGGGLDCRRENLRPATHTENNRGHKEKAFGASSQFRGVTRRARAKTWEAGIMFNGRTFYLGRFTAEADAARAYDKAARKLFGKFASPNFP